MQRHSAVLTIRSLQVHKGVAPYTCYSSTSLNVGMMVNAPLCNSLSLCLYSLCHLYILSQLVDTVEPRLADTPEKRTSRLCEHFLKSQRLALFYLYKLPPEMRTPCYSVLRTAPCVPPYTTLYKPYPIIRTFRSAVRKWPLPDLHRYL